MALGTLRANKLRSFLTVFGVIIGVITVMLIASIIAGVDTAVTKEVESFGTRSMYISKYNPGIHIGRMSREERMRKALTYDDAIAFSQLPTVEVVSPLSRHHKQLLWPEVNVSAAEAKPRRRSRFRAPCRTSKKPARRSFRKVGSFPSTRTTRIRRCV